MLTEPEVSSTQLGATSAADACVLALHSVVKRYGPTLAVDDLDLELRSGQVHALLGENGAGKSTAAQIAAGVNDPTAGEVLLDGKPVVFSSAREAEAVGVVFIPQELRLFGPLTVAENLFVGRPRPRRSWGIVDGRKMRTEAADVLSKLGLDVDVRQPVELLSPAVRQIVAIGRALILRTRVLIMDEPTASLDDWESARLIRVIEGLRSNGVAVLYVSHRLSEIREVADWVTVMRDGRAVARGPVAELDDATLVHHMVGRSLEAMARRESRATDRVVLRTNGLTGRTAFEDVSLRLHEGEVLGIAGLVGAGRTQLAEALFGSSPASEGTIEIRGSEVRIPNVQAAVDAGIGYVPEERQSEGLFTPLSVKENVSFVVLDDFKGRLLLDERKASDFAAGQIRPLDVKGVVDGPVSALSGGNQQKVMLAKWLATRPRVLILNEPTRGVDVGIRAEIYRIIDDLAADGVSVIVISSDLTEIQLLSDRILVMHEGRLVAEFDGGMASDVEVGRAVLGHASTEEER